MREIKFRGKDGDFWVYGSLIKNRGLPTEIVKRNTYYDTVAVDPNTVGQFTGLTDEDGREIYEGDIVRNETTGETGVVFYVSAQFVVKGENDRLSLYRFVYSDYGCRVIGNVHDNPELLERGS